MLEGNFRGTWDLLGPVPVPDVQVFEIGQLGAAAVCHECRIVASFDMSVDVECVECISALAVTQSVFIGFDDIIAVAVHEDFVGLEGGEIPTIAATDGMVIHGADAHVSNEQ